MFKKLDKTEFLEKKDHIKGLLGKYYNDIYPGKTLVDEEKLYELVFANLGETMEVFLPEEGLVIVEIAFNEGKNRKECIVWNVLNKGTSSVEEFDETLTSYAKEKGINMIRIYADNPLPISKLVKKVGYRFTYGVMEKELKNG